MSLWAAVPGLPRERVYRRVSTQAARTMEACQPSRPANGCARFLHWRISRRSRDGATMGESGQLGLVLDIEQIKRLLPHRAPFLFVERLEEIVPFESAVGHKTVSFNEPHFAGHFPDYPVMPGVLIVEAMAQTAGALVMHTLGLGSENRIVYFLTIDKARFRRPVRPGDVLRMPVKALRKRGPVWRFVGQTYVGESLCAEAQYSAMIADRAREGDEGRPDSDR